MKRQPRWERISVPVEEMRREIDIIRDIRIVGAMIGIELQVEGGKFVQGCMEEKLLINCTQGNVIRLLPASNTPLELVDTALDILESQLRKG